MQTFRASDLSLLPEGASVYEKLKHAAFTDTHAKKVLLALESTMTHFKNRDETLAETILRMNMAVGSNVPEGADNQSKTLLEMLVYFRSLL